MNLAYRDLGGRELRQDRARLERVAALLGPVDADGDLGERVFLASVGVRV